MSYYVTDVFLQDKHIRHAELGHFYRCYTLSFVFEENQICYMQNTFYVVIFDSELFQFKCYNSQEFVDTFLVKNISVNGVTFERTKDKFLQIKIVETTPVLLEDIVLRRFRFYKDRYNPDFTDTLANPPRKLTLNMLSVYTDGCFIEDISATNMNICLNFHVISSMLPRVYPFLDENGVSENSFKVFPLKLKGHTGVVEVLRWYTLFGKDCFHGLTLKDNMFIIDAALAYCEYEIMNPNLIRALVTEALFNK